MLLLSAAAVLPLLCAPAGDDLRAGFLNPPQEARARAYWWWLNGNTTTAAITRDLEQMKAKGFGGALLVDANGSEQRGNRGVTPGPMFGSPEWRKLYRHALAEASRLGLEISLNIQSGWNLGGPTVTPEHATKLLTWSRATVEGPAAFQQTLAPPPQRNGFYRDIAVLAYPLAHGTALAGSPGAGASRRPIRALAAKSAAQEFGMSMPRTTPLLEDVPPEPGEQDARVTDVQDLTGRMNAYGSLQWQVPAGTWEILRMGYTSSNAKVSTSSGAWQGLVIDYLDRDAFQWYWQQHVAPLLADARPYLGRALRYLVTDSWELGGVNWTGRFRDEFHKRRGYDPLPYLPIVAGRILDTRDASNRFLNDLRRTVGDLVIAEHYAVFASLASKAGLGIHPESGGPHGAPIDGLQTLSVNAFPQSEFWARAATHRIRDEERFFIKHAASAAHIYGKTLVAAESFTSIGPQWEETIGNNLKPSFDQAITEGLNRLIWHTFTSSPREAGLPGQEYFAGTHMNPNVTWWNQSGPFVAYINRTSFLMQQGRPVADVLYYYGDHVPNFAQLKSSDPAKVLPGYDYDVTDENALNTRMTASGGRIVLPDGMSYRLLVLPEVSGISPAALRAIRKLAAGGAVVLGAKPRHATGLRGDEEVAALAAELWGDCAPGKPHRLGSGAVHCGESTRDLLAALGTPPDFESRAPLDYIHRQTDGADLYFIRNTAAQPVHADVTLRSKGKMPELWHPDTGSTEAQTIYDFTSDGRTRLPLWLEPYGSVFVVFRSPAGKRIVQVSKDGGVVFPGGTLAEPIPHSPGTYVLKTETGQTSSVTVPAASTQELTEPWTVRFTPGWGAPPAAAFPRLQSWTDSTDPAIRYYSGTATYSTRFRLPAEHLRAGRTLTLDLGSVHELAQVKLNGKDLGILWKKPFALDVRAAARAGWNDLEIAVTNLWPNRLIGDQQLPPEKRLTRTNITRFKADSPLLPSGLLGPVTLRSGVVVRLMPAR